MTTHTYTRSEWASLANCVEQIVGPAKAYQLDVLSSGVEWTDDVTIALTEDDDTLIRAAWSENMIWVDDNHEDAD